MTSLHNLTSILPRKRKKRLGRGPSSGLGKTSGRGEKGDGSRSGYKRRFGRIGGAMPLHMKMPIRGFSRKRFAKPIISLNLDQLQILFSEGETASIASLIEKKIISKNSKAKLKILSKGEIDKKISVEASNFSKQAREKLEKKSIPCKIV